MVRGGIGARFERAELAAAIRAVEVLLGDQDDHCSRRAERGEDGLAPLRSRLHLSIKKAGGAGVAGQQLGDIVIELVEEIFNFVALRADVRITQKESIAHATAPSRRAGCLQPACTSASTSSTFFFGRIALRTSGSDCSHSARAPSQSPTLASASLRKKCGA